MKSNQGLNKGPAGGPPKSDAVPKKVSDQQDGVATNN